MSSEMLSDTEYKPRGYVIRVPKSKSKHQNESFTISPPTWLLVDQTVAVIWDIYSKNPSEKPLGIVQLQWVHEFLKGVKNRRGEYTPDVKLCIQDIEERLIDTYARLAEGVDSPEKIVEYYFNEQKEKEKEVKKPEIESITYNDDSVSGSCFGRNRKKIKGTESRHSVKSSTASDTSEGEVIFEQSLSRKESYASQVGKSSLKKSEDERSLSKEPEGGIKKQEQDVKHKAVSWHSKPDMTCDIDTENSSPSSVTYQEIAEKTQGQELHMSQHKVSPKRSCFATSSFKIKTDKSQPDIIGQAVEAIMQSEGRKSKADVSKDEVLQFLLQWKNEQILRIQEELKRYHSIDNMIKNMKREI